MIKGIQGYNEAVGITGENTQLPVGAYECVIKKVSCEMTKTNKLQFIILFDIAEGEHKDFFKIKFEREQKSNKDAKYKGIFRQFMEGNSLPYYKGILTAIQRSNSELANVDFSQDWNENILVNKKLGILFNRREIEVEGKKVWITQPKAVRSIDSLYECELPKDEPLKAKDNNTFYSIETVPNDDNLPF